MSLLQDEPGIGVDVSPSSVPLSEIENWSPDKKPSTTVSAASLVSVKVKGASGAG